MTTRDAVLREALDQFVINLTEHVESQGSDATAEDIEKLSIAETMLDQANAEFLSNLGVSA